MQYRIATIGSILALLLGSAALAAPPAPEAQFAPGELIVKFKDGFQKLDPEEQEKFFERHGIKAKKDIGSSKTKHLEVDHSRNITDVVKDLEADPNIEYAEPNYTLKSSVIPYDASFPAQWGLNKIQAPEAWDNTKGSKAFTLGVIDSGLEKNHEDFKGNVSKEGYDAIRGKSNPKDDNGHGTHVAGIFGAVGNNGYGVAGVNWETQVEACKFLDANGGGSLSNALLCIDWFKQRIAAGAPIVAINNSWSGGGYSKAMYDAIKNTPALFVVAAGNDARNNDVTPAYPASYNLPNIISVAASDQGDMVAPFSNYGTSVHVTAPGVGILSTAMNKGYETRSGTSMAAPYVTGIAGLIKAAHPDYNWTQIRNLILSTGDSVAALDKKTLTGKRVNAYKAVTCQDERLLRVVSVPKQTVVGEPITLSALSINCEKTSGPVTVALSDGTVLLLSDDGAGADLMAGDGVFTTVHTPIRAPEAYLFSSPAGEQLVMDPAFKIMPAITAGTVPKGYVGKAFEYKLSVSGGFAPYTWSSSALPTGLTLSEDGTISGTPAAAGTRTVQVRVTDRFGRIAAYSLSMTVSYPVYEIVGTLVYGGYAVLPNGKINTPYSYKFEVEGGTAPHRWSLYTGSMPAGLKITPDGYLTGTPTATGEIVIGVHVTDAKGQIRYKAFRGWILTADLAVNPNPLADVVTGTVYKQYLDITGGGAAYQAKVIEGSMPVGSPLATGNFVSIWRDAGGPYLSFSAGATNNILPGLYWFTLQISDNVRSRPVTARYALRVVSGDLSVVATPLPSATTGAAYTGYLSALGGSPNYTFAASGLPAGLAVASVGKITGTPTFPGNYIVNVTATDKNGISATAPVQLTINPGPISFINTPSTPTVGIDYSFQFAAKGGTPGYTWSILSGSLPPGLSLSAGGLLSGTPTAAGTYPFTVKMTDAAGKFLTRAISFYVGSPAVMAASVADGKVGTYYKQVVAFAGGVAPYKPSISGTLPRGLYFNATSMLVYGTPSVAGTSSFSVIVTDAKGIRTVIPTTISIAPR